MAPSACLQVAREVLVTWLWGTAVVLPQVVHLSFRPCSCLQRQQLLERNWNHMMPTQETGAAGDSNTMEDRGSAARLVTAVEVRGPAWCKLGSVR